MRPHPALKFLAFLWIASAASCHSESAGPAVQDVTVWRPIGSWSGRGLLQTEAFIGETGAFRFEWQTSDETPAGAGTFRAVLHSSVSGRPLLTAIEHRGAGRGTVMVNEDPREFFIVVHASNVRWSLTVDEAVRATATASGKR